MIIRVSVEEEIDDEDWIEQNQPFKIPFSVLEEQPELIPVMINEEYHLHDGYWYSGDRKLEFGSTEFLFLEEYVCGQSCLIATTTLYNKIKPYCSFEEFFQMCIFENPELPIVQIGENEFPDNHEN